jgi:hypothetical protein
MQATGDRCTVLLPHIYLEQTGQQRQKQTIRRKYTQQPKQRKDTDKTRPKYTTQRQPYAPTMICYDGKDQSEFQVATFESSSLYLLRLTCLSYD